MSVPEGYWDNYCLDSMRDPGFWYGIIHFDGIWCFKSSIKIWFQIHVQSIFHGNTPDISHNDICESRILKMMIIIPLHWCHNGHDSVSNHQPHDCLLNRLFRRRSKKISKLRVTGLCAGNSPETSEFPAQMASSTENVSIWWRHHAKAPHFNITWGITQRSPSWLLGSCIIRSAAVIILTLKYMYVLVFHKEGFLTTCDHIAVLRKERKCKYCQTSNIRHQISSHLASRVWRCSWSSADRWCSNYI